MTSATTLLRNFVATLRYTRAQSLRQRTGQRRREDLARRLTGAVCRETIERGRQAVAEQEKPS